MEPSAMMLVEHLIASERITEDTKNIRVLKNVR